MGDRDRTRACSLHCGSLCAPRCETLMFFFLPCDAQTRDLMDEADYHSRADPRLGVVGSQRSACAQVIKDACGSRSTWPGLHGRVVAGAGVYQRLAGAVVRR